MAAGEDDVAAELEAVEAVYGDDCVVLDCYPPRLHLHIKPRTADVASQQFVEAMIEIRAGPQEPPQIYVVDSKGLDVQRQKHLTDTGGAVEENMGNCPVCRKGFHAQDLDHVLHLVDNEFSRSSLDDNKDDDSSSSLMQRRLEERSMKPYLNYSKQTVA